MSIATRLPGLPSVKFEGGYAQASYVLTGETRTYNPGSAAYNGIVPANPFSLTAAAGAPGKSPAASAPIDLNDQLATANGVAGGRQTIYTAGLNWYVNRNVRFMFNYLHGDIAKQVSADQLRRCRREVRCVRDADPGRVLATGCVRHESPSARPGGARDVDLTRGSLDCFATFVTGLQLTSAGVR